MLNILLKEFSREKFILLFCVILATAYSPIWHYEYHRDELLFLSYGKHLDFGYYSSPPLIGLFSFFALKLPIDTYIVIRIIGIISFTVFLFFSSKIIRLFSSDCYLRYFAVLFLALVINKEVQLYHVSGFDVIISTVAAYYLIKFIHKNKSSDFTVFVILIAIGVNNKYTILFYFIPLLALLFYKKIILFDIKKMKLPLLCFIVLVIPHLLWQIQNDFLFMKYINHIQINQTKDIKTLALLKNILLMSGLGAIFYFLGFWSLVKNHKLPLKLFAYAGLISISIVLITRGRHVYCYNFFPLFFCVGLVYFNEKFKSLKNRNIVFGGFFIFFIAQNLLLSFILPPQQLLTCLTYVRKHVSKTFLLNSSAKGNNNTSLLPTLNSDMLGWNSLVSEIDSIYKTNSDSTLIFCQNYGEAAAVEIIGRQHKLPSVFSMHDIFYYWALDKKFKPINPKSLLMVSRNGYTQNISTCFKSPIITKEFKYFLSSESNTNIYLISGSTGSFPQYFEYLIQKVDNPSAAYTL